MTKEEFAFICRKYCIEKARLNKDGTVDVNGDVYLRMRGLGASLPLRFGSIFGDFDCSNNRLSTLSGAPFSVTGDFDCSRNKIESLEGGPKFVGGEFSCYGNLHKSLKHSPKFVGGKFFGSSVGMLPYEARYILLSEIRGDIAVGFGSWELQDGRVNGVMPSELIPAKITYLREAIWNDR